MIALRIGLGIAAAALGVVTWAAFVVATLDFGAIGIPDAPHRGVAPTSVVALVAVTAFAAGACLALALLGGGL